MHKFINGKYHSAFNAITDILCINYCYRPTAGNHYDCNCTALNNRYSCPLNLGLRGHIVLPPLVREVGFERPLAPGETTLVRVCNGYISAIGTIGTPGTFHNHNHLSPEKNQ